MKMELDPPQNFELAALFRDPNFADIEEEQEECRSRG
jgi:hypothetical protein